MFPNLFSLIEINQLFIEKDHTLNNLIEHNLEEVSLWGGPQKKSKPKKPEEVPFWAKQLAHGFAKHLYDTKQIEPRGDWKTTWPEVLEKLNRIDGFSPEEIRDALAYAVGDEFWSLQIISIKGLRKRSKNDMLKFENLVTSFRYAKSKSRESRVDSLRTSAEEAVKMLRRGRS